MRRQVLIPLWNVYSFFTTYAILDNWIPESTDFDPAHPEGPTPQSDNPLDAWILARLNQVVQRVTVALENYDAFGATLAVEPFIDDLTNWYVRRSRRRFWRSERDADKLSAYATLYHVLIKLVRTLAPIMPFVPESIYQNLVRNVQANARESVHHTDWPRADAAAMNESLVEQMELTRRVASLGLSARTSASLKVRQPLAKVLVFVGESAVAGGEEGSESQLSADLVAIVQDELNVKAFEFVADADALVSYRLLPNNKILGPKLGQDLPKVRAALEMLDGNSLVQQLTRGNPLKLDLDGQEVALATEEVLVQSQPAEGLVVAAEKGITVAVDSVLTPELEREGHARELVRRIQQLRKDAGLEISDRITLYVSDSPLLSRVLADFRDYVMDETLTVTLETKDSVSSELIQSSFALGGDDVTVAVQKV